MNRQDKQALVLNVDDTDAARYAKTRMLVRAGFNVIEAATGAEALRRARAELPDLVLLDTRLPDINGFEVCRQLKEDTDTRPILVLQTSASYIGTTDKVRALDTGADNYLIEPIEPEELVANVRALVRLGRVERELREVDRRKNEFLAILAHELRNPLGPIRSAVELLRRLDPYAPPVQENARQMIIRQTDHMVRLVDDLLDVSRISQGKFALRTARITLRDVVDGAVEITAPLVEKGGHTLDVDVPAGDCWIEGDKVRLSQAVSNLVNNAVKFTPSGGRIEISVAAQPNSVVIRVSDNGIGIAPEHVDSIFNLFAQADYITDRVQEGLGIGLALVRTLVDMHHGTVAVSSGGPGMGSTFEIRLPRATPPAEQPGPETGAGAEPPGGPRKQRIVVVDDNADSAEMIASLLQFEGHEVQVAHTGATGIALAKEVRPDIAFLDIGMPDMSGYAVAGALRDAPGLQGVALVALTGYGQDKDRDDALNGGFDVHLTKPVTFETLVATVERLAARNSMAAPSA
jgi:signal transduction histidine kinase